MYHPGPYHPGQKPIVVNGMRFLWAEATRTIYGRLRYGLHPELLSNMFKNSYEQASEQGDDDNSNLYVLIRGIFFNLEDSKLFKHLPSYDRYLAFYNDPVKRSAFEIMMYNRFENEFDLMWAYMDEGMHEALGQSRSSSHGFLFALTQEQQTQVR
jgi:hypothetical protein